MKALFIVDGEEKQVIEHLCGKNAQVRTHGNGKKFSPERIGELCADEIEAAKGFDYYIILADLERRERQHGLSHQAFVAAIHKAIVGRLKADSLYTQKIIVASADRMIENWYYAGLFGENIDGQHGKKVIADKLGAYRETLAITYFQKGEFDFVKALSSPSFQTFAQCLPKGLCPRIDNVLT